MPISVNMAIGLLVLPALTFVPLYGFALTRLPHVNSTYSKANVSRRLIAATLDMSLVATCMYFFVNSRSPWFVGAGALYIGARDGVNGRSVGKFMTGLVVVTLETGTPCSLAQSVRRNLVFLFPGVNLAAVFLEGVTALRDPFGYRLGDLLARTQVVEGFGARDFAAAFLRWIAPPEGMTRRRRAAGI